MGALGKATTDVISHLRGDSLKARSSRGMAALGVGTVIERALKFASYIILARLMLPEELYLIALIIATSALFEAISEVGIKQSVIQNKRGREPEYLNVAWWFQVVRGVALYVIAFFAVLWVYDFYFHNKEEILSLYDKRELLFMLRVSFLAALLNSMVSPRAHVLEKDFRYGKAVFLEQVSKLLGTSVTIALAFILRNAWALVIGYIAEAAIRCLLSYILCPFLPRIRIHRNSCQDLFKFARGMFGLAILGYLTYRTDVLVLGKLMPAAGVGIYSWCVTLSMMPRDLITRVARPVLLSAFAERQDDRQFLQAGVLVISKSVAALGIPVTVFLATCSDSILSILYGSRFSTMAVPFALLTISALILLQYFPFVAMFLALGKPYLYRRFVMVRAILIVGLIYPGIQCFGFIGAALVVLVSNVIPWVLQLYYLRSLVGLSLRSYLVCWVPGIKSALLLLLAITSLRYLGPQQDIFVFIAGGLVCLFVCIVGLFWITFRSGKTSQVCS